MLAEEPRFTIVDKGLWLKRMLDWPGPMTKNLAGTPFLMKNGVCPNKDPSIADLISSEGGTLYT